jgi:RIO kinase 1
MDLHDVSERPDRGRRPDRSTQHRFYELLLEDTARRGDGVLDEGDEPQYSTWGDATHGPAPFPDWVVTDLGAVDTDLGVLKTGKEADVHLVERAVVGTDRASLVAAKRYRSPEHRLFHRDAGYTEGRRVRRSRETRAMARRTDFGRDLLAGQWANAEFEALGRLWCATADEYGDGRALVPYPVQLYGTEVMLEFIGDADGTAAPRLAQARPDDDELVDLWYQTVAALGTLAVLGLAHGDLSPYNVLVHDGRLVLIDLPQVVDIVANPQGPAFLARDVQVMTTWFLARGLPPDLADGDRLTRELLADAGLG